MSTSERINHLQALLVEAQETLQLVMQELDITGAGARADRMSMTQSGEQFIVDAVHNKADVCCIAFNTFKYKGDKTMLKGMLYVGDGTDGPYAFPCVVWESTKSNTCDFSGQVSNDTDRNADRIGNVFVKVEDNGIRFDVILDVDNEIGGRYRGYFSPSTTYQDFDYMGVAERQEEKKQPVLAKTKMQHNVKQTMPVSTTHHEVEEEDSAADAFISDLEDGAVEEQEEVKPVKSLGKPRLSPLLKRS